jgi:hypothetical protein
MLETGPQVNNILLVLAHSRAKTTFGSSVKH